MKRRVYIHEDGHAVPSWEDLGPSRARLAGVRGTLLFAGEGTYSNQLAFQREHAKRKRAGKVAT